MKRRKSSDRSTCTPIPTRILADVATSFEQAVHEMTSLEQPANKLTSFEVLFNDIMSLKELVNEMTSWD